MDRLFQSWVVSACVAWMCALWGVLPVRSSGFDCEDVALIVWIIAAILWQRPKPPGTITVTLTVPRRNT